MNRVIIDIDDSGKIEVNLVYKYLLSFILIISFVGGFFLSLYDSLLEKNWRIFFRKGFVAKFFGR